MKINYKLPEKWCVKRTIANSEVLNDWNNNHPLFQEQNRYKATSTCDVDYFYNDIPHTGEIVKGYTLISFEDFKKYVLDEFIEPEESIPENYDYLIPLLKNII